MTSTGHAVPIRIMYFYSFVDNNTITYVAYIVRNYSVLCYMLYLVTSFILGYVYSYTIIIKIV